MMEVAVCTALTGVWWMSSVTFLLPFLCLLKYNKSFRNRWFSFFFLRLCKVFEPKLLPFRKKAFDILKANLPQRDSSNYLKILEIGIGSGANLQFYPENSRLTALDMNESFGSFLTDNQVKYPQIVYDKTVTAYAEDMKDIDDSCMDIVISTYVLCSVMNVSDCMKEIKRVLKPGGKFLFLEHVVYPKSDWGFTVQRMADPLWVIYCDGCNLTRNTEEEIRKSGFSEVICEKFSSRSLMLFVRPQICGLATK